MIVKDQNQVFNLMDTNGRRNDVINALQGYINILNDIQEVKMLNWDRLPNSLAQFEFYRQAIQLSPDVFVTHSVYDSVMDKVKEKEELLVAIKNLDIDWIRENYAEYAEILNKFDNGIEDRARHYTSTLVKLGFVDSNRKITQVGKLLINSNSLKRDELEKLLPIDDINLIYLRQLMKLRIYNKEKDYYYSPFNMAIYILLKKERVAEKEFLDVVQGMNPYLPVDNIDDYINGYEQEDILKFKNIEIPKEINSISELDESIFKAHFKNQKSSNTIDIYWNFYKLLYEVNKKKDNLSIKNMFSYYEKNKEILKKAFGKGDNIFKYDYTEDISASDFIENHVEIFNDNINLSLYKRFVMSKIVDSIREYTDTTKRIFNASGLISFEKGIVELKYKEVAQCLFDINAVSKDIFGKSYNYSLYEENIDSYFCTINTIRQILEYSNHDIEAIKEKIAKSFDNVSSKEICELMKNKRKEEFENYIKEKYPLERVKQILALFLDRSNDNMIKNLVSTSASVPTIYEYIVGIAWYYFSGMKINIIDSFNLTLSADFEPLLHAGGGEGDIVIYDEEFVIMLEVTLMNANAQKRGEWEPVLRHSVNLKVKEEVNGKNVLTFFIADEFDANTINIWRAVAAVPLESSVDKTQYTDNVIIMPITTSELEALLDKPQEYQNIIQIVKNSFEKDKPEFEINWREKIIKNII